MTRAHVAGLSAEEQNREAEALKAKWLREMQQANKRTDELRDQL